MPGGGTYDLRAGLNELLKSPAPMQLINPRWEFQDANWWPDWPTSAKNIMWFYEKSKGPTVDGVIAINSDWLGSLLNVIGPVETDNNLEITAANFEDEIQKEVEINYTDKTQPKKVLSGLAPKIIDKIFNIEPKNIFDLSNAVKSGLDQKDILVYLKDEKENNFVVKNGWNGEIKETNGDYLQVVATNIGGGKTDKSVRQNIYHQSEIQPDGSIINTVVINRYHFGPIDDNFAKIANRSYLRVYVPLGSELIRAEGFIRPSETEFRQVDDFLLTDNRLVSEDEQAMIDFDSQTKIYEEQGKTVFANWLTINPGQSQDLLLIYKLPFKITKAEKNIEVAGLAQKIKDFFVEPKNKTAYSLLLQKQPGSNDDEVISEVSFTDKFKTDGIYSKFNYSFEESKIIFKGNLYSDQFNFVGFKY